MSDVYAGYFFQYCAVLEDHTGWDDHTIHWMRRWHIGISLMGENVSESIHSYIAHLEDLLWIPKLV